MNRRDLFKSIAGIAAASGVTVKASTYEQPSTKPALVVLETDRLLSHEQCIRLSEYWTRGVEGTPFQGIRAVVLQEGLKLTIVDANGHVLNRTIEGVETA